MRNARVFVGCALVAVGLAALAPVACRAETEPPVAPAFKAPLVGLVTREGIPDTAGEPFIDGAVAHVFWRDLETRDETGRVFAGSGWDAIDGLLAGGFRVKLRLMAGIHAPDFVKQIGGAGVSGDTFDCSVSGGVAVVNAHSTTRTGTPVGGCVARFWDPIDENGNGVSDYFEEYEALISEIARRYESNEQFAEITNSACMTVYAEPFVRSGTLPAAAASNQRLWEAGLNETTDRQCFVTAMGMLDRTLSRTRIAQALNPWEIVVAPGTGKDGVGSLTDFSTTAALVDEFRRLLRHKLVVQNNGLGERDGCWKNRTQSPFCYIKGAASPKGFQTEIWDSEPNLYAAVEHGIEMGACFVELPGFFTDSKKRLAAYDTALTENCRDMDLTDAAPVATMSR